MHRERTMKAVEEAALRVIRARQQTAALTESISTKIANGTVVSSSEWDRLVEKLFEIEPAPVLKRRERQGGSMSNIPQ